MLLSVKVIHLLLVVILLKENLSTAYSPTGTKMTVGGCIAASNGEPSVEDSKGQNVFRKMTLRGRKMGFGGIMKLYKMRDIGIYEETWITSSRASRKELKKVLSFDVVKDQQSMRSLLYTKKDLSGFGAFTADYDKPVHHPPRHN